MPLAVRFDVLAGDERRAGAAFTVDRAGRVVGVGREEVVRLPMVIWRRRVVTTRIAPCRSTRCTLRGHKAADAS